MADEREVEASGVPTASIEGLAQIVRGIGSFAGPPAAFTLLALVVGYSVSVSQEQFVGAELGRSRDQYVAIAAGFFVHAVSTLLTAPMMLIWALLAGAAAALVSAWVAGRRRPEAAARIEVHAVALPLLLACATTAARTILYDAPAARLPGLAGERIRLDQRFANDVAGRRAQRLWTDLLCTCGCPSSEPSTDCTKCPTTDPEALDHWFRGELLLSIGALWASVWLWARSLAGGSWAGQGSVSAWRFAGVAAAAAMALLAIWMPPYFYGRTTGVSDAALNVLVGTAGSGEGARAVFVLSAPVPGGKCRVLLRGEDAIGFVDCDTLKWKAGTALRDLVRARLEGMQ